MEITLKQLKILLKTLEAGSVTEFEYQDDKYRLRLSVGHKGPAGSGTRSLGNAGEAADDEALAPGVARDDPNLVFVTSPFVGTFYRASGPDSEPFVEVGTVLKKGQALCIVEAMKLMNEIEAEFACTVVELLVENGSSVEFGQRLFKVRKT
jgi:acetyl-CoA carboxylase biotin carboxyl carrier protein